MGQFWVKSVATLNIKDKVATFDQFGSPGHQMIQAMKSRRDKSSCKQVETSPWGLNGKEDERAKMGFERGERGRTGKATAGELPPANKATCLGVRTFAKGDTTSTFHICGDGITSKHLKCPISKSNSQFFSNNPYSEPDADNSPNNDTDWDWGGGKASPCGSPGPNLDPDHQNPALTKTVLTGDDNTISK